MDKSLTNKRIPTFLAILVLASTVGITLNLVNQRALFTSKASTNSSPENLKIANITDTTFNVSFTTASSAKSFLVITQNGTENFILDDRDKDTGEQKERFTHFITVANLLPSTPYKFKLMINDEEYKNEEFETSTASNINAPPTNQKELSGKVISSDNNQNGYIVIAKNPESQLIAGITDTDGNFKITTTYLRSENLNSFLKLEDNDLFKIEIYGNDRRSEIESGYYNAINLPTILLGEKYDFPILENSISTESATDSSFEDLADLNSKTEIKEVKTDDQVTKLPTFSGEEAVPSQIVTTENPSPTLKIVKEEQSSTRNSAAMTGISLSIILIGVILLVAL